MAPLQSKVAGATRARSARVAPAGRWRAASPGATTGHRANTRTGRSSRGPGETHRRPIPPWP